jgi:AcrB/AcrD/AcrF family
MWIVRLALRRPFTVASLCLVILIMGLLSAGSMKVDIFPAINIPVVIVVWNYPGMAAEDMERRIVFVSERGISTSVSGITRIDSQSINGTGVERMVGGEHVKVRDGDLSGCACSVLRPYHRIERNERHVHVRRIHGNASVASPEHRVHA